MHLSTLTERTRRIARSAIRKVRSENRLVSRYLFNAKPVLDHRRQPPALGSEAVRVAAELERSGVALTTVTELIGDDALFQAIYDETLGLRARPDLEVDPAKPFLTELLGSSPALTPHDPLLALALHPEVRGIAETYCEMTLQVQDVNIWVNRPVGTGPMQSQRWHRDLPEDYDIVKCFVYLSDVPDGAGPLQYVTGSNTVAGRKVRLPAEFDGIGNRLDDEDVAARSAPTASSPRAPTRGRSSLPTPAASIGVAWPWTVNGWSVRSPTRHGPAPARATSGPRPVWTAESFRTSAWPPEARPAAPPLIVVEHQQGVLDHLGHRRMDPVLTARHVPRGQSEAHRLDQRLDQR